MANISVSDYAGAVDAVYTSESLVKSTSSTIVSLSSNVSSFSTTIVAGTPYQGNMRQLALDRWNYMYPS